MNKLLKKVAITLSLGLGCLSSIPYLSSCGNDTIVGEKGDKGDKGEQGTQGDKGEDGKSAYQVWLDNGHEGSEEDFLSWLQNSSANDNNEQGLAFYLQDDGTYGVSVGNAIYLSEITVPETYKGKKVTRIIDFSSWNGETISIPDTIQTINQAAFACSYNIKYNEYDNGYYLGNENNPYIALVYTMENKITSIKIHENCKVIGSNAFFDNDNLVSIDLPLSIININEVAFLSCNNLTSIEIPNSVSEIGHSAFAFCTKLTSITIPDSVTSIEASAFYNCSSLTSVILGNAITSIGDNAFFNCTKLTSITIPESITSIGEYAFSNCYSLVEVINKSSLNITKGSTDNGWVGYYAINIVKTKQENSFSMFDNFTLYNFENTYYLISYTGNEEKLIMPEDINGKSYKVWVAPFINNYTIKKLIIPDNLDFDISSLKGLYLDYVVTNNLEISTFPFTVINARDPGFGFEKVYYSKSKTEWLGATKEQLNMDFSASSNFGELYFYSSTQPTDTTYNYWHYVDGEPTAW